MSDDTDEEIDYMDPRFLLMAKKADKERTKIKDRILGKRKRKTEKPSRKSKRQRMEETRSEGLSTAISQNNKGYRLLSKLGYKAGMGLGRQNEGIAEPLSVQVRHRRKGLGKDTQEKEIKKEHLRILKERALTLEHGREDFRKVLSERFALQKLKRDLARARNACRDLDLGKDIEHNPLWSSEAAPVSEVFAEDPFQCLDQIDGTEEDLKKVSRTPLNEEPTDFMPNVILEEENTRPILTAKMRDILSYLRTKHFFCLFCGIHYDSLISLKSKCPGATEVLHEKLEDILDEHDY